MATSLTTSLPMWLTGCTYDANGGNDLRNSGITALAYDVGVASGSGTVTVLGGVLGGTGLVVTAGTGMSVNVAPGSFTVPNSASPTAGGYMATLASSGALTVQTADPSNPRVDLVVANVVDNGNSTSFGQVQYIVGTAQPNPSPPAAPANSTTLAQVSVPANTTTITSGLITDTRVYTVAAGGVIRAAKGTLTGYTGQFAYDPSSGSFYHNNGTTPQQAHVLPWAPVVAVKTSPVAFSGPETTIVSTTVTTDGSTDIRITAKWGGLQCVHTGSNFNCIMRMYIDSSNVDGVYTPNDPADGNSHSGGSWTYSTSGATADTPAAGTHTIKLTCQNVTGSYPTYVFATGTSKILLRVEPVTL